MILSRTDTWLVGETPFKRYKNPARSSFLIGQLPSSRLLGSLLSTSVVRRWLRASGERRCMRSTSRPESAIKGGPRWFAGHANWPEARHPRILAALIHRIAAGFAVVRCSEGRRRAVRGRIAKRSHLAV